MFRNYLNICFLHQIREEFSNLHVLLTTGNPTRVGGSTSAGINVCVSTHINIFIPPQDPCWRSKEDFRPDPGKRLEFCIPGPRMLHLCRNLCMRVITYKHLFPPGFRAGNQLPIPGPTPIHPNYGCKGRILRGYSLNLQTYKHCPLHQTRLDCRALTAVEGTLNQTTLKGCTIQRPDNTALLGCHQGHISISLNRRIQAPGFDPHNR